MVDPCTENQWAADNLHDFIDHQAKQCAAEWGLDSEQIKARIIKDWLDLAWPAGNA